MQTSVIKTSKQKDSPILVNRRISPQELRKLIGHFLKLNSNLVSPGQKFLTGLQAKLHYLKIISELPSYGAKCFSTNMSVSWHYLQFSRPQFPLVCCFQDSSVETVILVSPKFGVSQISSLRNTVVSVLSISILYLHYCPEPRMMALLSPAARPRSELSNICAGKLHKLAARWPKTTEPFYLSTKLFAQNLLSVFGTLILLHYCLANFYFLIHGFRFRIF